MLIAAVLTASLANHLTGAFTHVQWRIGKMHKYAVSVKMRNNALPKDQIKTPYRHNYPKCCHRQMYISSYISKSNQKRGDPT